MAMAARTDMNIDMTRNRNTTALTLQNWFSPAFPIGAFSYSAGLETAIECGDVHNRESLTGWLAVTLCHGAAFTDAVFLRAAMIGKDVNDLCLALCPGAERYQETTELGTAFSKIIYETQAIELPPGLAYPIAIGMAAGRLGLDVEMTLAAFLQGACLNQISVAVRTVPIGQMDGQSCLVALQPEIEAGMSKAMTTYVSDVGSFALAADLCALEHETAEQRIYRT